MSGNISDQTTNYTRVAIANAFDLRSGGAILSMATSANASGLTTGQLSLVFLASGISLVYSSGKSTYVIGQSAQSAAQA